MKESRTEKVIAYIEKGNETMKKFIDERPFATSEDKLAVLSSIAADRLGSLNVTLAMMYDSLVESKGLVFIPSSETLVRMKLAEYVTYENIDKAEDTIKSAADYILDRLEKEKEKE